MLVCEVEGLALDFCVKLSEWVLGTLQLGELYIVLASILGLFILQDGYSKADYLWLVVLAGPVLLPLNLVLAGVDLWCDSLFSEMCNQSCLNDIWVASGLELSTLLEHVLVGKQCLLRLT